MSESKKLIDLLHLLLCDKQHSYDMLEISNRIDNLCYYHLENDISEGDSMDDHLTWTHTTEGFKVSMDIRSDEDALEFVRECIRLTRDINSIAGDNKFRKSFIKSLLLLRE